MKTTLIILFAALLFSHISSAQQALIPVQRDGHYGYGYDANSISLIIPAKYDDAHYFFEGLAAVMINGKWGFINKDGSTVVPLKYTSVNDFYEGMARVGMETKEGESTYEKCGFINKTGTVVIPLKFYNASGFNDVGISDVAVKDKQGNIKWGFINKTGALVGPAKYDSVGAGLSNGYEIIAINHKIGFVNNKGVEVIAPTYEFVPATDLYNLYSFNNGQAVARLNNKCGVIDEKGKVVIPFKYDVMHQFKNGLALVSNNHKWGFINQAGEEVIPCNYASADDFLYETTSVKKDNGETWTIDKTGKELKCTFKAEIMDTTVITGTYNGKNSYITINFSCQSNSVCTYIIANDKSHKFPGINGPIDISRLGIKKGDDVTVKVVNRQGCSATMASGGALSGGSGGNNRGGRKTIKLFGN